MKITNEQIATLNILILRIVDYEGFTTVPSSCYWNLADAMNDVIQLFDFEDIEIGYCETLNSNPLFTRVSNDTIYYFDIYGDSSTYYDLEAVLAEEKE